MKKAALIMLLVCFKTIIGQTTTDEYNYLESGYIKDLKDGRDIKKGYAIKDINKYSLYHGIEVRECVFIGMYKTGIKKPVAILMKYQKTTGTNEPIYIVIPNGDVPELWSRTIKKINEYFTAGGPSSETVIYCLMKLNGELLK